MYLKIGSEGSLFDESEIAEQIENDIITVDGPVRPLSYSPDWLPIIELQRRCVLGARLCA